MKVDRVFLSQFELTELQLYTLLCRDPDLPISIAAQQIGVPYGYAYRAFRALQTEVASLTGRAAMDEWAQAMAPVTFGQTLFRQSRLYRYLIDVELLSRISASDFLVEAEWSESTLRRRLKLLRPITDKMGITIRFGRGIQGTPMAKTNFYDKLLGLGGERIHQYLPNISEAAMFISQLLFRQDALPSQLLHHYQAWLNLFLEFTEQSDQQPLLLVSNLLQVSESEVNRLEHFLPKLQAKDLQPMLSTLWVWLHLSSDIFHTVRRLDPALSRRHVAQIYQLVYSATPDDLHGMLHQSAMLAYTELQASLILNQIATFALFHLSQQVPDAPGEGNPAIIAITSKLYHSIRAEFQNQQAIGNDSLSTEIETILRMFTHQPMNVFISPSFSASVLGDIMHTLPRDCEVRIAPLEAIDKNEPGLYVTRDWEGIDPAMTELNVFYWEDLVPSHFNQIQLLTAIGQMIATKAAG